MSVNRSPSSSSSDRYVARDAADAISRRVRAVPGGGRSGSRQWPASRRCCIRGLSRTTSASDRCRSGPASARGMVDDSAIEQAFAERGRHHLAADGEPPPGAVVHRAARRRRLVRTGPGGDDHLVVDAEPAHPPDVRRPDDRPRSGPHPRHRAGGGGRLRRQDQHLRRGITSPPRCRSGSACRSSGSRSAPRRSWQRSTAAARSLTSILPRRAMGRVLALKMRLIADIGAYNMLLTAGIPTLTMTMASGVYAFPAIRAELTEVFTNKTPTDAYRGAGRPEGIYYVERAMDMLARELADGPPRAAPQELHSAGSVPVPDTDRRPVRLGQLRGGARPCALEVGRVGTSSRAERDAARAEGRVVGLGLSMYVEVCGLGPSRSVWAGGWEYAQVTVERDGRLSATTGASPHGQGNETTFAQMLADQFGHPDGSRDDPPWRHGRRQAGRRHVRQPVAGGGRNRDPPGGCESEDEDGQVRGTAARGSRGGPGVRERPDRRLRDRRHPRSRSPRWPPTPTGR